MKAIIPKVSALLLVMAAMVSASPTPTPAGKSRVSRDKFDYMMGEADGLMWAIAMRHGEFAQAAIQLQEKQIAMQDPRKSASERKAYMAGFDAGSAKLPHP